MIIIPVLPIAAGGGDIQLSNFGWYSSHGHLHPLHLPPVGLLVRLYMLSAVSPSRGVAMPTDDEPGAHVNCSNQRICHILDVFAAEKPDTFFGKFW